MADEGDRIGDGGTPGRRHERLRRAALHYLERYASSEANLRRVLARKLRRWAAADAGSEPEAAAEIDDPRSAAAEIDAVVAHCRRLGFLDDKAYAETKVASGRRKGLSSRRIAAGLAAKGVDREAAATALSADEVDDAVAALRFARRKRLGPWRTRTVVDPREADRRDVAALCRNGYSLGVARRVVGLDRDAAEARLAGEAD